MSEADRPVLSAELQAKLDACRAALRSLDRVAVAFSGGVDSTFLVALAAEAMGPENVLAVMGLSPSFARGEREPARRLAASLGVELVEIETGELADAAYAANRPDRCYHCKRDLLRRVGAAAGERGISTVATGANADDTGDFRPGLRAGREFGAAAPLIDAGLTKAEIRSASRAMGLATWDKPSMACLASRVPYGRAITAAVLGRIERAEEALRSAGFVQCRVRDHGAIARIEVPSGEVVAAAERAAELATALKALGYTYVALDLEGFRSGSLNEALAADGGE